MTVWEVFAASAAQDPAAVAIRGAVEVTRRELAERAAALADELSRTRPGAVVALDATGAMAGAVAFLAAAKARRPLLPLNPDSPPRHRAAMLAEARPALLLGEGADGWPAPEPGVADEPLPELGDAAYVMYTSGSTGRPKGVVVSHQVLLDRLRGTAERPGVGPGDAVLAMTALSFDPCLAELLVPLLVGGQVVAAPDGTRLDPAVFAAVVAERRPDVIQATPSFWRLVLAWGWEGAPGARLWCGGEVLTPSLATDLLRSGAELWNVYGPTEGTIWSTAQRVTAPDAIGLGDPLPGTGLLLADAAGRPVPDGEPGEILLYGDCLATGYLGRPDLTAERFGPAQTPDGRRRCYRTGDRARRIDGRLAFLGRTDHQVKLRGHRIELGEVEAVLAAHPAVREAVVVLRDADEPDRAHLAAFVTGDATRAELRAWLAERLPAPLRPSRLTVEPALPRTPTGKVDRTALARGGRP